ncbi:winged helix-turn-helix transcriptional regulator [Sphingomonas hylomeconis]|uniref:Winged helix-turn-helix transcriptional regulator n=1 Tax=Sphingomonas hylomeconis TaxID=1395958 RepID=A0ABV7SWI4_9SPHN|nr:helix-turn-helix domain-containing protein [Sphingomonas hylomeconis]
MDVADDMTGATSGTGHRLASSSARRALDILGDRWTLMILHLAFKRVRRFDDFRAQTGMARSLLTDRLRRMELAGIIRRERYQERPPRDEYRLTPMGLDLFGASLMIIRWEKRWFFDPRVDVHALRHSCGNVFLPELRCTTCGEEVVARDVIVEDGPGAGMEPPQKARAQRRSIIDRGDLAPHERMLERAIEVIGDRWTAQTIASAFSGVRRFGAFEADLGVAPNILTDRLTRLVDLGILKKEPYQQKPARFDYRLTPEGLDLFPLIVELIRWGDRWLSGTAGPPQLLRHRPCGTPLVAEIRCDHCHRPVDAQSTAIG